MSDDDPTIAGAVGAERVHLSSARSSNGLAEEDPRRGTEVVRYLALRSGNLALVGDMNQSIYEWRGPRPHELLMKFHEDFKPVTTMSLEINYRATRVPVQAANSVASRLGRYVSEVAQRTEGHREMAAASGTEVSLQAGAARSALSVRSCRPCRPSADAERGERISVRRFDNEDIEANWVSRAIRNIVNTRSVRYDQIGVLTRTNGRGEDISKVFAKENLPHVTVEQFQFFAREETKDALACLKILINPRDKASVTRVLLKLAEGVGDSTIRDINVRSQGTGLALSDLISHARRLGLSRPGWVCYDTLDLAQRFITSPGYSLGALAQTLGLKHEPTHKAFDDVLCTCDLLRELMPLIRRGAHDRQTVVLGHSRRLKPFAQLVNGWRANARTERPADLLQEILEASGIRRRYAKEPNRLDNLDTMCHFGQGRQTRGGGPGLLRGSNPRSQAAPHQLPHETRRIPEEARPVP